MEQQFDQLSARAEEIQRVLNYNVKLAQRDGQNSLYTSMKILERQLKSLQEEFDKRVQDVMVQLNRIKDLCDLCGLGLPLQL